jgi:hypothetical protein
MTEDFNVNSIANETISDNSGALVEQVKVELNDIDNSDLTEHAARFDALHGKLQEALNSIDGL